MIAAYAAAVGIVCCVKEPVCVSWQDSSAIIPVYVVYSHWRGKQSQWKQQGYGYHPPKISIDSLNGIKFVEALRETFKKYGYGILGNLSRFEAAVFDLLDEWHCKDERIVLHNAIESGKLLLFPAVRPLTNEMDCTEQKGKC